jgi:SAM-dependent methyltransferase
MKASAYYDTQITDGAAVNGRIVKAAKVLSRHVRTPRRFVDIGCGTGTATKYIGETIGAQSIAGVDISARAVEDARHNGIDAYAVDTEAEPLPFADGSVDAIHCGEVIEHVVDTDHLLDEIKRILAPHGVCVLTTPNLAAWHNRAALLLGYQPFLSQVSFRYGAGRPPIAAGEGGGHLRMFTRWALREFLRMHGVEVIEERGVGIFELGEPPGSRVAKFMIAPFDALFTHIPSLACDTLVAFRHPRGAASK